MGILDKKQREQCVEDLTYRLNAMLAWDLMEYIKAKYKVKNKVNKWNSVYDESQVLVPALEISIVFGRQLLEFLRINLVRENLEDRVAQGKKRNTDDVVITDYNPNIIDLPINDPLTIQNGQHFISMIKVANKAVAHMTTNGTTEAEFESMKIARMIILQLIQKYVPEVDMEKIWWIKKDSFRNAILN